MKAISIKILLCKLCKGTYFRSILNLFETTITTTNIFIECHKYAKHLNTNRYLFGTGTVRLHTYESSTISKSSVYAHYGI